MNKYEELILRKLVDSYRKSKKDTGDNTTNRRTKLTPEKVYSKYKLNDGDYEEIKAVNEATDSLANKGYVNVEKEDFGTMIIAIYLVDSAILEIEKYLETQYGYIPKDRKIEKMKSLIEKYQDASEICSVECRGLKKKLEKREIPSKLDTLDLLYKAVSFIENNEEELYIREASSLIYGDSKFFEDNTISSVCNLIRKYNDYHGSENDMNDEILANYHIFKEPQKLAIKGDATIRINGIDMNISGLERGVEFSISELSNIECIKVFAPKFMTIENRTSYLRYYDKDTVVFYLGGYTNRYQRDFLKKVYNDNKHVDYYHFGDIDAGGFLIHQNLCEITGVKFKLFCMSENELKNSAFESCIHELTENDIDRLKNISEVYEYKDTIKYMLDHKVKLEQEIISLNIMRKNHSK